MVSEDADREDRLTLWQRLLRRRLLRMVAKQGDEPLTPEDWEAGPTRHRIPRQRQHRPAPHQIDQRARLSMR
jgi:hypothetical protein